jgi:hypothetical protein
MPARIQRERTSGWSLADATTNPLGAVIVSRPSRFGNRFTLAMASEMGYVDPREAVVGAFAEWLRGNRDLALSDDADRQREQILDGILSLRGRGLACYCPEGEPCHGDELLRLAALPPAEYEVWATKVRARVARNREWRGELPLPERPLSPVPTAPAESRGPT